MLQAPGVPIALKGVYYLIRDKLKCLYFKVVNRFVRYCIRSDLIIFLKDHNYYSLDEYFLFTSSDFFLISLLKSGPRRVYDYNCRLLKMLSKASAS